MDDLMAQAESSYMKEKIPQIEPGDTVRVRLQVPEGTGDSRTTRAHTFQGTVIACSGGGINKSITVRRVTFGIGVERTFPLHSPLIEDVEVVRHGKVNRAKLYYLRSRHERAARLKERKVVKPPKAAADEPDEESEEEAAEIPDSEADANEPA